jgi:hypothetical protein
MCAIRTPGRRPNRQGRSLPLRTISTTAAGGPRRPSADSPESSRPNSVVQHRRRGCSRRRSGSRRAPAARPAVDCSFAPVRATSTATAAAGLLLSENLAAGDRVDRGGPDFLAEPSVSRGPAPAISGVVRSSKALVESIQVAPRLWGLVHAG